MVHGIKIIKFHSIKKFFVILTGLSLTVFLGIQYIFGVIGEEPYMQPEPEGSVFFLSSKLPLKNPLYYVSGRLYLPAGEMLSSMGGVLNQEGENYDLSWGKISYELHGEEDPNLSYPIRLIQDTPYLSLYDFTALFSLTASFECEKKEVYLNKKEIKKPNDKKEKGKAAYLRLEDVSAQPNYSGEAGEKLRAVFDYLWSRGQQYYIAWIPLYTNPSKNIQNDLTTTFNFYNADFIHTLDYGVGHNGHIVIHGLTHQEKDTQSGVGCEFGPHTPFSNKEIDRRMKEAKRIASSLGYDDSIFEFPHYASTSEQLKIAERNFDVIYQQSFYRNCLGKIHRVWRMGRSVRYVPTTVSFLDSIEKLPAMLEEIKTLPSDYLVSLFVHPYMDFHHITFHTDSKGIRSYQYDENGVFSQLIHTVSEKGLDFSSF